MDKYVARQPIKSAEDGKVIGYEVMFQTDHDALYNSPESAAADTIAGFLMQNNATLFHENLTFITFTPSLLFRNTPKIFEKDKLVIQVEDNIIIHPLATVIIKRYCEEGYHFAINDFQFSPKYFSMLEYVEYIKINVSGKQGGNDRISLDNIVKMMAGFNKKCIATGVNTEEDYNLAKEINADYMEGSYIADSLFEKYNRMDYLEGNFFQLVVAVSKDEPDIEEIERVISRDTALTYALLKMVNSAYFALRRRTSSIRQALVTMGISQLRQWVYLLSFNKNDHEANDATEELLKVSFLRATFAAELSEHIEDMPISKSESYMLGMFSTLEYMIDAPLEEILNEIPVADEIKQALLSKAGKCGLLYDLVLEYEKANWKEIKKLSSDLGIPSNVMAQTYLDCVEEVNQIWEGLTSNFEREGEDSEEELISNLKTK